MDALVVNGSLSSDSTEIRVHIVQFYAQLYLEIRAHICPTLDGLSFNSIGIDEGSWLKREFESEVYEVVRTLNGDKALGPKVFSLAFFQSYWRSLKRISW
jgi:hypothetical protein